MTERDPSVPSKLPSIPEIQKPFDMAVGYAEIGAIDDPLLRLPILDRSFVPSMTHIGFRLHRILTTLRMNNTPWLSGRKTARGGSPDEINDLYDTHGLDRIEDVETYIIPQLRKALDVLYVSTMPADAVLETFSALVGVTVAESQMFSDGNNRIARTLHDFVRDGRGSLDQTRIYDTERTFSAPASIEKIILEQNTVRLFNGFSMPGIDNLSGGMYVNRNIRDLVSQNKEHMMELFEQSKATQAHSGPLTTRCL